MRPTILTTCVALLWFAAASPAGGQTATSPAPAAQAPTSSAATSQRGEADFGLRLTSVSGDPARYQRLRDLRTGPTLDLFRYGRQTDRWTFAADADHVGYRDQHYVVGFNQYGKVKAAFEWNQIPLFYSTDTQTAYREEQTGVFRLNDVFQAAVQNGAATKNIYLSDMKGFDLRSRRHVADMRLTYSATRALDLSLALSSTTRHGAQPWGATFGFNNAIELPVPIDTRTNDLEAAAEWSNQRGMARLAYTGSWFANQVETLTWDNPLRFTDQTTPTAYTAGDGSSQGRMALWPDSTAHTVAGSGAVTLPARSRAFAYLSIGNWLQDQALLPHTINSAIQPIPLSRSTADAEARIVAMTYRLTSRPTNYLWLSGQYRLYDYDNRTPRFTVGNYVRVDGTVAPSVTGGSEPFGYKRQFADLDASFTSWKYAALRVGYGLENDHRTFRYLDQTTEHVLRTSLDSQGLTWGTLRLQFDHADRTGKGFDEEAFSDIGEQVSLRQFDISDRVRNRVTALMQAVPSDQIGFTAAASVAREHRPDAALGLQDNDLWSLSGGIDASPSDMLTAGVSYTFENYSTLQRSRQANPGPQFDDPTRDWSTDMGEQVHTLDASVELPRLTSRASLRFGWDYMHANAAYLYVLPPNSTISPPPVQLPDVMNSIGRVTADVRYGLKGAASLGFGYWYERYNVRDFAMSPGTLDSPLFSTFVNLTYLNRPYRAHTAYVRLLYGW